MTDILENYIYLARAFEISSRYTRSATPWRGTGDDSFVAAYHKYRSERRSKQIDINILLIDITAKE